MTEKVTCPYCGAEMVCSPYYFPKVYQCAECGSRSPEVWPREGETNTESWKRAEECAIRRAPIAGDTSDGYHTFNELYHHRAVLFSVIVRNYPERCWKAKRHHDGTMYDGMFIVGIDTPDGQASYHYDIDPYWDMFDCREMDNAPEWDGHTPAQAIERIGKLRRAEPENRVLTLEEYMRVPEVIWIEANLDTLPDTAHVSVEDIVVVGVWCGDHYEMSTGDIMGKPSEDILALEEMGRPYRKAWRCWLRKPSEEERRNTPWEG